MATDLVLPAPSAQGLVLSSDRDLAARLRFSSNLQISTSWTKSENGRDELARVEFAGISSQQDAKQALSILDAESKPAEASQISKAFGIVVAVCVRPADMDDAKVFVWGERMRRVLGEYPASVALTALNEWPQTDSGKFWPTEHELRLECEERMELRNRLRAYFEHRATLEPSLPPPPRPSDGMSDEPLGDTAEFVARFKAKDAVRANMYLAHARYTPNSIGVHSMLAQAQVQKAAREAGFDEILVKVPSVIRTDNTVAEWAL